MVHGDVQHRAEDDERRNAQRQVDVEDPPPRQVLGEHATQQGPYHRGHPEHGAEEAHVAAPLARRDDVADHSQDEHHEPAAADALKRPEADELGHVLAHAGQGGANDEDRNGGLQGQFAAVLVAQLAP